MNFKNFIGYFFIEIIFLVVSNSCSQSPRNVIIVSDKASGPVRHGIEKLEAALVERDLKVLHTGDPRDRTAGFHIYLSEMNASGPVHDNLEHMKTDIPDTPEALIIRKEGDPASNLILFGSDPVGLMYAALDVAEKIRRTSSGHNPFRNIHNAIEQPEVRERSVSVFTMQRTYWERRMYDENYWKKYFDMLAESRINNFVVVFGYENGGFLAPVYPYFFNVDEFPGVRMTGLNREDQAKNVAAFRTMISLAHERGINFVPGIWDHIYRGGVQSGGISGMDTVPRNPVQGLVWGLDSDNLSAYTRTALAKFIATFPEIDGIQFRIHWESGLKREETPGFWHEVFHMIRKQNPDMRIDLRAKGLPDAVIRDAVNMGLKFRITTKYWMEQMGLPFHPTHINVENQEDRRHGYADLLRYPKNYDIHWRLWNGGTSRVLLWGDPGYVRRFIASTKIYHGNSFEVNEPLATKMEAQPHDAQPFALLNSSNRYYKYEFERYWYFYKLWGRLGYDPSTDPGYFESFFDQKFGEESGPHIRNALEQASRVLPMIVAATYRYNWFPMTRGWPEKMRMDDLPDFAAAEGSDIQQFASFSDEADHIIQGTPAVKRLPSETASWFSALSGHILAEVSRAEKTIADPADKEYISTVTDLRILAYLAAYYGKRIPAAIDYNLYLKTGDPWALSEAITMERSAVSEWIALVDAAGNIYTGDLKMGICNGDMCGHWKDELKSLQTGLTRLVRERDSIVKHFTEQEFRIMHIPVVKLVAGDTIRISASVSGNPAPAGVICRLTTDGGLKTYPLEEAPDNRYWLEIPYTGALKELKYYLEATSPNGKAVRYPEQGKSDPLIIRVMDELQPPTVDLLPVRPPKPGQPVEIHVVAKDSSGIDWVRIRYRHLTQFEDYQSLVLTLSGDQPDDYFGVIPGEFVLPEWDLIYFVEAMDLEGNARMYPPFEKEMPYVVVELDRN